MRNHSAIGWLGVRRALVLAGYVSAAAIAGMSTAQAQTYSVLYSFKGGSSDGMNPEAGLVIDQAGNLYGTTVQGPKGAFGIAFKLSAAGQETIAHRFKGSPDGASPYAGMTLGSYGTCNAGGTSNLGVVFRLAGGATVLHSFTGAPADGAHPYAGLIEDPAGNVFGTTSAGGQANHGTVFEWDAAGTETVLYSFMGGEDGAIPYGSLTRDSAGNLYGTTSAGGVNSGNCFPAGCGTVFKLDAAGKKTILHNFGGAPSDGAYPYAGVIRDSAGNLYGTTYSGGSGACTNGCGTVFELDKDTLTETVLYSFTGYPADGAFPYAGLVQDTNGNLYGTTVYGGTSDNGIVFKLNPSAKETVMYNFTGGTDGGVPRAPLVMDPAGNLYGTTYDGGLKGGACGGSPDFSCGVVFKLTP
jgi:uncharacterized repeat protein (TIGR03803 family)